MGVREGTYILDKSFHRPFPKTASPSKKALCSSNVHGFEGFRVMAWRARVSDAGRIRIFFGGKINIVKFQFLMTFRV